jgi:peptide/nickel transport system ATP-binding protein
VGDPLLEVSDLVVSFRTDGGYVRAVDGATFHVDEGTTLGIVGESGCGKSVAALSIMRLIPSPPGTIEGGKVRFKGRDLLGLKEAEMRRVRGNDISMIFQEPMTSLNPVYTVGTQIVEAIRLHQDKTRRQARTHAVEMLKIVGIASPETNVDAYPHQLSGGMRQRVMIAMALACEPKLLIADEPTTALDVTIQAQILELLRRLQDKLGMSIIFITHDLGVIAETAKEIVVMYAGRVVERGLVEEIFARARHPYTRGLLASIPDVEEPEAGKRRRLPTIEGMVPDLASLPAGCRFADRCSMREPRCTEADPELREIEPGHFSRCVRAEELS